MKKTLLSAVVTALLVTGCGGSSSGGSDDHGGGNNGGGGNTPVVLIGQFIDSAVQGLDFQTATEQGTTNTKGEFKYQKNEEVTFSIGDLTFPSAAASTILTPLELAGTQEVSDPEVINMVRLLMTLDTDGNPDNGITISPEAKATATPLDFDVPVEQFSESQDVLDFVSNAGQDVTVTELVPKAEAQSHFQQTLDDLDALDTYADYVGMFNLEADDPNPNPGYTSIMNIYPDGSYLMIEYYEDEDDSGLEYGDLGLENGSFNPDISVDTNSVEYGGLSSGDFNDVFMDGETLHMTKTEHACEDEPSECTYELTTPKVVIAGDSIVGSWETQDGNASYNFRDDGHYFLAQVKDPKATLGEGDIGIEVGTYSFDKSAQMLTLDIFPDSDSSGSTLLANNGEAYAIHSAILSEDSQILTLQVDYGDGKDTELKLNRRL